MSLVVQTQTNQLVFTILFLVQKYYIMHARKKYTDSNILLWAYALNTFWYHALESVTGWDNGVLTNVVLHPQRVCYHALESVTGWDTTNSELHVVTVIVRLTRSTRGHL
jgi:hypothetical protein